MTIITDPRCTEYAAPGHPERPERVSRTLEFLKAQESMRLSWELPPEADEAAILRAHTPEPFGTIAIAARF